jgi:hypothetical protein
MAIKPPPAKKVLQPAASAEDWISGNESKVAPAPVPPLAPFPATEERRGGATPVETRSAKVTPKPAGKTAPLMVRLDDAVLADMDEVAHSMGVNRQALVKLAVAKYLRELAR